MVYNNLVCCVCEDWFLFRTLRYLSLGRGLGLGTTIANQRSSPASLSGLGDSLPLRFVGGLLHHCVILWAVSAFLVRVFIAASGHGVVLWFVQHRRVVIDSRVSLCCLTLLTEIFASCAARFARCYMSLSCHFHTLLPFTCADDSCVSLWHASGLQFPRF